LLCAPAFAQAPDALARLDAIKGQALNSHAYSYLQELSDGIGPRLTGSPNATIAARWAAAKMEGIGLKYVHLEPWRILRGWRRGLAHAELVSPIHLPLNIVSYGWAGSTPKGGLQAGVVLVDSDSLALEIKKNASSWAGKVLFVAPNSAKHIDPMRSYSQLASLAIAAHAAHAVAVIRRDPRPGVMLTHTGPVSFSDTYYPTPIVDIAQEHYELLKRLLNSSKSVRINIEVRNTVSAGPVTSYNVIGEIPGYERPEHIVILGAHLDSWDLGTGAIDDGFGVAAVLGAAEVLVASQLKPRSTIRFILFTGEEQGLLGSDVYLWDHQAELINFCCAFILDWGQGPITEFRLAGHYELMRTLDKLSELMSEVTKFKTDMGYLMFTDAYSFTLAGLSGVGLLQESRDYTLLGHSAADTLDKIDPDTLARNTAVLAISGFWIADQRNRTGMLLTPEDIVETLTVYKQRTALELLGLWPLSK
jgi:carboxypeptidase Q